MSSNKDYNEMDWEKSEQRQMAWAERINNPSKRRCSTICDCGKLFTGHKRCGECTKLLHGEETCNCIEKSNSYISQRVYWGLTE